VPDQLDKLQPGTERSLVLASGNRGKLRELTEILTPLNWTIRAQGEWSIEDAVEDGRSFVENALIKARHAASHTGLMALADDSGLVIDALGGAPGIHSSRYAGEPSDAEANNRKLLEVLLEVPVDQRTAHFYCVMVLLRNEHDPAPLIATGSWHGNILFQPQGSGGFGYDPLFWVESHGCSAAELEPETKNRMSHRGKALLALVAQLSVDSKV
jgi:XTP/dITP diphosphohydrolase